MVRIADKPIKGMSRETEGTRPCGTNQRWHSTGGGVGSGSGHQPSGPSGGPVVDGTGPGGLYLSQMAPASEISSASVLFCPDRPPFSPLTPTILRTRGLLVHWSLLFPLNNASRRALSPAARSHLSLYLSWPFCPNFIPFFS